MAESWIAVAVDGAGKKVRNLLQNIAGTDVYQQVVSVAKSDGTLVDDLSRSSVTQPVSAASLPLPTGASTESTLGGVKTGTDHLDVNLSTVATQTTAAAIKAKTDNLDIALSALRDAIAGGKTQNDIVNAIAGVLAVSGTVAVSNFPADQLVHAANLDVALSTRLKPGDAVAQGSAQADGAQAWLVRPVGGFQPYLPADIREAVLIDAAESAPQDNRAGFRASAQCEGSRDTVGAR